MLKISHISKKYQIGNMTQEVLKDVSVNFRESELVAILGPSGSGKTTLLNIIGGLDRYDSGDLIINGISTKQYKDADWDSYRNHTVGFVFQSYQLIPHQSVLANVELALTISGVSKKERRIRAKEALIQVGLGDHIDKKPHQMSGGQMQRVAIARALINNPKILLADEPTGALDTETSLQIMALLKEVAKDRLVIMVTHNPELAHQYATRIVSFKDGRIEADTHPLSTEETNEAHHKNMGKATMQFSTALGLSFNNLKTKKGRTILTAFAGSIGIIGIALILSLSHGISTYIEDIQRETMTSYPVKIEAEAIDLTHMMEGTLPNKEIDHLKDNIYADSSELKQINQVTSSLSENNLTAFKNYLDQPDSVIHQYVGENGIVYSYATPFGVYGTTSKGKLVDANIDSTEVVPTVGGAIGQVQKNMIHNMSSMMGKGMQVFEELLPGGDENLVSPVITDSYEMVSGTWPQNYDEVVLVLDKQNQLKTTLLHDIGLVSEEDYQNILSAIEKGETYEEKEYIFDFDKVRECTFTLIPGPDYYQKDKNGLFQYVGEDEAEIKELAKQGITLKIAGIIRPIEDAPNATLTGQVGYTTALTDYLIDYAKNSEVVKAQQDNPEMNIISGMKFKALDDATKIEDAKVYLETMKVSDKAKLAREMITMSQDAEKIQQIGVMGEVQLAGLMDEYFTAASDDEFLNIYDTYISTGSYEENMSAFGYVNKEAPTAISIYVDTFEDKDKVAEVIKAYNEKADAEDQITYTDFVALMTSSVTTIINVVSYVLIAFVGVSLVVSSIMIGIITYISVLERTKEIGILRAIGASKKNISQVFNAETILIGLLSGVFGVGISSALLIPINHIIQFMMDNENIRASLPVSSGIILIILSVSLTFLGGLMPARKAAQKDPVAALRSE